LMVIIENSGQLLLRSNQTFKCQINLIHFQIKPNIICKVFYQIDYEMIIVTTINYYQLFPVSRGFVLQEYCVRSGKKVALISPVPAGI
jgi:hypothetical protein